MKKSLFYLMMMLLSVFPSTIIAAETTSALETNTKEMPAEVKVLFNRLEEIKEMDKSSLSYSEKKELRKEVRTIKKELKKENYGVYFSIGAIIVVILALILLLS